MRTSRGFTLIEILAVVLIMAMLMYVVTPGLGGLEGAKLREASIDVAGRLELARQQAVVTGKPHRLLIDLDESSYRIEWWVSENEALGIDSGGFDDESAVDTPLSLAPPADDTLAYRPLPNRFGDRTQLDEAIYFEGVDTPEGWLAGGEVAVVFDRDGTTDPAEIVLAHDEETRLFLEIRALASNVRIHDAPE